MATLCIKKIEELEELLSAQENHLQQSVAAQRAAGSDAPVWRVREWPSMQARERALQLFLELAADLRAIIEPKVSAFCRGFDRDEKRCWKALSQASTSLGRNLDEDHLFLLEWMVPGGAHMVRTLKSAVNSAR